jgi:GcrA cell cycle regulator
MGWIGKKAEPKVIDPPVKIVAKSFPPSWNKNLGWTPAQLELVKKRWIEDGFSAAKIADELGNGRTRNSVIGKISRSGWNGQKARGQIADTPARPNIPKISATPSSVKRIGGIGPSGPIIAKNVKALALAVATAKPSGGKAMPALAQEPRLCSITDLKENECKWPLEYDEMHLFCGNKAEPGKPYCKAHHRGSYQTITEMKAARNLRLALASGGSK